MATYYFRNTGNVNWGTSTNWSLTDGGGATGAVPTATDDAYFTSNSGSCTVDTSARVCNKLVFSGVGAGNFSGTFTLTQQLTASSDVTLSATMTIAGANTLIASAATTATLTSNGNIFTGNFRPGSIAGVFTIADTWTVTGTLTIGGGQFTGGSFIAQGNIATATAASVSPSTTTLIISGTASQAWSASQKLALNTTINKTGGTLTIGSVLHGADLTYVQGTIAISAGSTFTLGNGLAMNATVTLAVGGITFGNFYMDPISTSTVVLSEPLYVGGTLTLGGFSRTPTINGSVIYARGASVTTALTSGTISGTASLMIDGSGTQTVTMPTIGNGRWCINTTFNNPNIVISGTFSYGTSGTLTALQPVAVTGGSTLQCGFGGVTFNTSLVPWQDVSITANSSASGAITLGETLYAYGNVLLGSAAVPTIINGSSLRMYGNLTCGNTNTQISGTSVLYLEGDGPQVVSMPVTATTGAIRNDMVIDNKYTTFTGTFFYNTGTLTFLSGIIAAAATFNIGVSTTIINAHLAAWGFISVNVVTLTMNEFFSGTPDIRTTITPQSAAGFSVSFTDGFEKISKFIKITGANILNPNQLIVITDGWNKYAVQSSAAQNRGIRGINTSPNGISKNKPSRLLADGYGLGTFLVSDPNTKSMI